MNFGAGSTSTDSVRQDVNSMLRSLPAALRAYFSPSLWSSADETTAKLFWIINLRWLAFSFQLLSAVPGVYLGFLPLERLRAFLIVIFLMCVANALSARSYRTENARERDLFLQLSIDLLGLCVLLSFTGGLRNPFAALLLFHAALSPLLLGQRWNHAFFALILLSTLALLYAPPPLLREVASPLLLTSQLVVTLAIWKLTSWLSETLALFRQNVHRLEQQEYRMDRLRAVGALTSGFCHEFATPLNTIQLKLDRLERRISDNSPQGLREDLRTAREAVRQCDSSLKELLRAHVDDRDLRPQLLSLEELVGKVCEGWLTEHPEANLILSEAQPLPGCRAPQLALSQTILNLLDNALHASAPGAAIHVHVCSRGKWLVLSVSDSGPGLPELVLEKLGEPFVTTKPNGTGLGLYNASNLLGALGGRFRIHNRPEGGVEALLYFPCQEEAMAQ